MNRHKHVDNIHAVVVKQNTAWSAVMAKKNSTKAIKQNKQ